MSFVQLHKFLDTVISDRIRFFQIRNSGSVTDRLNYYTNTDIGPDYDLADLFENKNTLPENSEISLTRWNYIHSLYQAILFTKISPYDIPENIPNILFTMLEDIRNGDIIHIIPIIMNDTNIQVFDKPYFDYTKDIEIFEFFNRILAHNILECDYVILPIGLTINNQKHYVVILITKTDTTTFFAIYDPAGPVTSSVLDKFISALSKAYRHITDISSKTMGVCSINRSFGIQYATIDNPYYKKSYHGYCVMNCYMWLYMVILCIQRTDHSTKAINYILTETDKTMQKMAVKLDYSLLELTTSFASYYISLFLHNLFLNITETEKEIFINKLKTKFEYAVLQYKQKETDIVFKSKGETNQAFRQVGEECDDDYECFSGNCDAGLCVDGNISIEKIECKQDDECLSGQCNTSTGYCLNKMRKDDGYECDDNDDCLSDNCIDRKCMPYNFYE